MSTLDEQSAQLEAAIAGLEVQRSLLGDAVVEPALAALRKQLSDLRHASVAPAVLSREGERKVVTVMFADISGFTAMSEKLDPEQVRSLMNACFEHLVPVVEKYQGTVDKFIGDEIMTLFGAPIAHENDPERALRAALEMMNAMTAFNAKYATYLGLHIGINTGAVIAGSIGSQGRQDYSVMGDAVNLAARLEDASQRGEIFVGPETYRQTAPLFDFEALSPLTLKGKAEPVTVYRLLGLKIEPGELRGIQGLRSPLVGRDDEMAQLQDAFRTLQRGDGGTIAIVGEAGLGKSRLVTEARQCLAATVTWAEGRGLSYAEGMSYWMARDVLYNLLEVKADASSSQLETALRRNIWRIFPERVTDVYPYLARLLEVSMDETMEERVKYLTGEALQGRILQAFKEYVRARSHEQPLVLFWEDLHWSDPSSLHLLETLLPLSAEVPLLLLLAFRPESDLIENFHQQAVKTYKEKYRVIELEPLTHDESASLIENLLKIENLPEEARKLILERAEGNPFFLEELLRSLIDAGMVVVEGDCVIAARAIEEVDVPHTLQGVLMARIDRLPQENKYALQTASVIGRVFQQRVLTYLYDQEAQASAQLDDSLGELQRREFIRLRKQKALGAAAQREREYIFKHAVTQDVTYHSLLIARRKQLHKLAGEAIEALFSDRLDELAATLGYHFQNAEVRDKAARYLFRAADRAKATFANKEALALYRTAIDQIKQLLNVEAEQPAVWCTMATQLYEGLGDVLELTGEHDDARSAYQSALAQIPEGETIRRSRLYRKFGSTYVIQRRYEETLQRYETAEIELGQEPAELASEWWQEWVQIQLDRMWVYYWQGMVREMTELAEQSRPIVEQHGTPIQRGKFFQMLALYSLRRDRYVASEEAVDYAQAAVSTSQESDNLGETLHIRFVLGFTHLWRGSLAEAEQHLQATLGLAERVGDVVIQLRCLTYLTLANRKRGRIEETRNYLVRSLRLATEVKMIEYIAMAKANIAWVAWREGELSEARAHSQAALEMWHQMPVPYMFDWMATWPLIGVALTQERIAEAIECIRILLEPKQQPLPDELAAVVKQAIGAWEQAQVKMARAHLHRAVRLAQETGYL
jgi:class 3 adenylate cyclase/tetratricopeptide (TPR) repeat protein